MNNRSYLYCTIFNLFALLIISKHMNNTSPEKLILLASTITLEIVKDKSVDEINACKNLFSLIANNLSSYCQQKSINKQKNGKN